MAKTFESRVLLSLVLLLVGFSAHGFEDPTGGQPFLPWFWDQVSEPAKQLPEKGNLRLLATGAAATVVAFQYENDVFEHNRRGQHLLMSPDTSAFFSTLGGGALGIGIAATQLLVDQENGIKHSRALLLTSATHVSMAFLIGKERPGERKDFLPFHSSFPSGHTSSAFATATSLAYAYGYPVGIPAYAVATAIGLARVTENAHWLSDVVAGATLGMLWGRASHLAPTKSGAVWMPVPMDDGWLLSYSLEFE